MTPLEAARRLSESKPIYSTGGATWRCIHCCAYFERLSDRHHPDCPWLRMPAIVAALKGEE